MQNGKVLNFKDREKMRKGSWALASEKGQPQTPCACKSWQLHCPPLGSAAHGSQVRYDFGASALGSGEF